jgi:phosphohistidine phosphatase SixA
MIDDAQLWLLRHGEAVAKSDSETPAENLARPLTAKGVRQSINAGKLLRELAPPFAACYCSPALRTKQTATLACQQLGIKAQPKKALLALSPHEGEALVKDGAAVLLVGHGPGWCDDLVQHLTGREVAMRKGAVAGIHIVNGQGSLDTLLTPSDIAGMV